MLLNGGFNWQIYLPGVDGARAKVLYKEEGQELLIEVLNSEVFYYACAVNYQNTCKNGPSRGPSGLLAASRCWL